MNKGTLSLIVLFIINEAKEIPMKSLATVILIILLQTCINSQKQNENNFRLVGGPCEGCEAVFEYGERVLSAIDTLPDFNREGPKLKVTGTIFQPDGKTPAENVILYVYHTDQDGIYPTKGNEKEWARRHGYLRGWLRTGADGKYTFYTLKPGIYPSGNAPAHIHATILEPDGKYYWIEEYLFEDDPLLSSEERLRSSPRGGSPGILDLTDENNLLVGKRDIILGKNIPNYD